MRSQRALGGAAYYCRDALGQPAAIVVILPGKGSLVVYQLLRG